MRFLDMRDVNLLAVPTKQSKRETWDKPLLNPRVALTFPQLHTLQACHTSTLQARRHANPFQVVITGQSKLAKL
jgi:hypothetical protein